MCVSVIQCLFFFWCFGHVMFAYLCFVFLMFGFRFVGVSLTFALCFYWYVYVVLGLLEDVVLSLHLISRVCLSFVGYVELLEFDRPLHQLPWLMWRIA